MNKLFSKNILFSKVSNFVDQEIKIAKLYEKSFIASKQKKLFAKRNFDHKISDCKTHYELKKQKDDYKINIEIPSIDPDDHQKFKELIKLGQKQKIREESLYYFYIDQTKNYKIDIKKEGNKNFVIELNLFQNFVNFDKIKCTILQDNQKLVQYQSFLYLINIFKYFGIDQELHKNLIYCGLEVERQQYIVWLDQHKEYFQNKDKNLKQH